MAKYVPLSRQAVSGKSWKRTTDLLFAAADQVVPVVAQELAAVAPEMPIGFIKDHEHYRVVALLSLRPNDTSISIQAHDRASGKRALCIDEANLMDSSHGEPFFEGDRPSKLVKQVMEMLEVIERGSQAATSAVSALAEAKVIVPWELKLRAGEQTTSVAGIYRVDEAALNELPDAEFLKLRKVGAIPVAYAQLMSMQQMHLLTKLADLQGQLRTDPKIQISKNEINEMFTLDDGMIQF